MHFFFFLRVKGAGLMPSNARHRSPPKEGLDLVASAGHGEWLGWAGGAALGQAVRGRTLCSACSPSQPGNEPRHHKTLFHPAGKKVFRVVWKRQAPGEPLRGGSRCHS